MPSGPYSKLGRSPCMFYTRVILLWETSSVLQNSVSKKNLLEIMEDPKTKEAEANNNIEVKQRPQVQQLIFVHSFYIFEHWILALKFKLRFETLGQNRLFFFWQLLDQLHPNSFCVFKSVFNNSMRRVMMYHEAYTSMPSKLL